jgi:hypothetical protein
VSSALLNGLSVSFLLQIDDLVPSIFLSPKTLNKIETYLVGEAVREMAKKDAAGFYGYIKASPFIAAATAVMGFITQHSVLNASRSVTCAALIYLLHYRATIFFGLWCTGALYLATEAGTCAIIGLQQRQLSPDSSRASVDINEDAPVPSASGVPKWVAPVLAVLVRRIVYLLAAAFTLNLLFFYLIRGSFYGDDFFDALMNPMHESFLFDLLGTCAQGSNYAGTSCLQF